MAAIARTRTPLRIFTQCPNFFTRHQARLLPQLQARLPRTSVSSFGWRTFTNSAALQEKKYTTEHEWVELSKDGKIGTIGVSIYAAKNLGDVVFVELPTLELEVSAGDSIGAVESVKSASDIMTPMSGKIIEANDALNEKPGIINEGPETEGWIAKIEVKNPEELKDLMDEIAYGQFTAE